MTLKAALNVVKRHIVLIIIATVVFGVGAFFINYFVLDNTYTCEATLTVTLYYNDAAGNKRFDSIGSVNFANTYAKLLKSDNIMLAAKEKAGVKDNANVSVSITNPAETTLIKITVVNTEPQVCALIANAMGKASAEYIEETTSFEKPVALTEAQAPKFPTGPARARNTVLFAALGAFLSAAFVIGASILDTSIRSETDIEQVTKLPILASIFSYKDEIKRVYNDKTEKDTRLFVGMPERTRENVRTLLANIEFLKKNEQIRTITTASTVYGEGKSSVSVMLASALAEQEKSVLIIDMDVRTPAIGLLSKKRGKNDLVDFLTNKELKLSDVAIQTEIAGVSIIDSRHANIIVPNVVADQRFQMMLETARAEYDYVIFDTPPISVFVDAALISAYTDATLLLVRNGKVEKEEFHASIEQLKAVGTETVGVVFTFADANSVRVSNRNKNKIPMKFKNVE